MLTALYRGGDFRASLTDTAIELRADYKFDKPLIARAAYTDGEIAKTVSKTYKEDEVDGHSDSAMRIFAPQQACSCSPL